jgi:hypothetical protein
MCSSVHSFINFFSLSFREWFEYGILIPKSKVAFSDPTPDGRRFAAEYMGINNFLVYKYNHCFSTPDNAVGV